MKKIILIAMLIIPFFGFTKTENSYKIKGTLTDSYSHEPLPFVNLRLELNGVVVGGAQSDVDGHYLLEIPCFGTYNLRIIYLGFCSELHQNMVFDKAVLNHNLRLNFELESEAVRMEEPICHKHCDCLQESFKKIPSELKGKIIDKETGEPMPFVNIVIYQGNIQIAGGQSDFNGNYLIKPLKPGTYTIKTSSVGFKPIEVRGVRLDSFTTKFVDLKMESAAMCCFTRCYSRFYSSDTIIPEPIVDLFAEQDSINDTITALLPSTLFSSETQGKELSVYPNPTSGEVTIASISGVSEITIFDMTGKVMKMMDVTGMMQQSIDLSFYKPGVYFLRYMKDGELKTQRISKL